MKALVIIPAYNEEGAIVNTVKNLKSICPDVDYVIIDDCSKDRTLEIAKQNNFHVIHLPINLGIGGAVQTGYKYAYENDYDVAIQMDADGQHDVFYIEEMRKIIEDGQADMVIGSRFIKNIGYKPTMARLIGIKINSAIIKILTKKKIYDTTSGFRAINRGIIEEFSRNYPYDYPEPCTNMEMILKGKKIKEIPVKMYQRKTGVSSIPPLKSIKYMLKVTLSLFLMKIKKDI